METAFKQLTTCSYFDLEEGDRFIPDLDLFPPKFEVLRLRIRDGRVFGVRRRYDCGYTAKPQEFTTNNPDPPVLHPGPRHPSRSDPPRTNPVAL